MSNRKRPRGRPSKYPPEFQRDAVAMVLDEHRSIADVARAISVNPELSIGRWVRLVGVLVATDSGFAVSGRVVVRSRRWRGVAAPA